MIRIERDPEFWINVARHPALEGALLGLAPEALGEIVQMPDMLPLAARHGGYLVARTDRLGALAEVHALFTPEGWGREAAIAAVQVITTSFAMSPLQMATTYEVRSNPRSRPPISVGFRPAGDWFDSVIGEVRMWTLSRISWENSPVRRRKCRQQ